MLGQTAHGIYAGSEDMHSYAATVQVKSRDTLAEVALTRINNIETEEDEWGQIGITQVVSASGVENWGGLPDWPKQAVFRKQVTSVTFTVWVWNTFARGRLLLNYWS
jgi:hypothetical protein